MQRTELTRSAIETVCCARVIVLACLLDSFVGSTCRGVGCDASRGIPGSCYSLELLVVIRVV